jgi:hypothetical protein
MSTLVTTRNGIQTKLLWAGIVALGAVSFGIVALSRGETVNAAWLVIAALCICGDENVLARFPRVRRRGLRSEFRKHRTPSVDRHSPVPSLPRVPQLDIPWVAWRTTR